MCGFMLLIDIVTQVALCTLSSTILSTDYRIVGCGRNVMTNFSVLSLARLNAIHLSSFCCFIGRIKRKRYSPFCIFFFGKIFNFRFLIYLQRNAYKFQTFSAHTNFVSFANSTNTTHSIFLFFFFLWKSHRTNTLYSKVHL